MPIDLKFTDMQRHEQRRHSNRRGELAHQIAAVLRSQAASGGSQRSGQPGFSASPPAMSPAAAPVADRLPYTLQPPMDWSLHTRMRFASTAPLRMCEDATLASGTSREATC